MRAVKLQSVAGSQLEEVVFAKNQPEYISLPALLNPGPPGECITEWELSQEDIAWIVASANQGSARIRLTVLTFGQKLQPVQLEVVKS